MGMPRVGVLAIQGAVEKHLAMLARVGAAAEPVLHEAELDGLDALIIPGGESTTMSKGIDRLRLGPAIQQFAHSGRPILGTCAGAILLARRCLNHPVPTLELLEATARRNAYGTQLDSFAAPADPGGDPALVGMRCIFIRAPQLSELGRDVEVLLRVDGLPVLVREATVWASTFHPELGEDDRVHRLFLGLPAEASTDPARD